MPSENEVAAALCQPLEPDLLRADPAVAARAIIGKLLLRQQDGRIIGGRVVECEAYLDDGDEAAHAASGKTPRNAVLFGPPGFCYVFLVYGAHCCLNVACLPEGRGGCVLLRSLEPLFGLELMARNRSLRLPPKPTLAQKRALTSGPGRLAAALGATRARDNGKQLCGPQHSDLWLADDGLRPDEVVAGARVGIRRSAGLPLRFTLGGSPYVSPPRP